MKLTTYYKAIKELRDVKASKCHNKIIKIDRMDIIDRMNKVQKIGLKHT